MVERVGLLTLPLHTNYGGIIQIAALYQFLVRHGKKPLFLRKKPVRPLVQRLVAKVLWSLPGQNIGGARAQEQQRAVHYPFIDRFMPNATKPLRTSRDFARAARRHDLQAVAVGSDQVWRLDYHADGAPLTYFLDFVDPATVRRISYAASFGHSTWSYPDFTEPAAQLLSQFHAVGVREESGVDICRDSLGRTDARVVLDPTLLVDPVFYDEAVAPGSAFDQPTVVKYVLDQSAKVQAATAAAMEILSRDRMAIRSLSATDQSAPLDIPHWLQAFRDAEFVITDSFHGTIFAIVFKKRFVTVPNHDRGFDRFVTLLGRLGLSERLLTSDDPSAVGRILAAPIDYDAVDARLSRLRTEAADFLLSALA